MEQGYDLLCASKKVQEFKQEYASPQRAMFNRLGGLASSSGYIILPLSQPLLQSIVLGFTLSLYLLSFLLLSWAAFPRYGNVCYTFLVPCWAIPLEHCQCLCTFLLSVILLCIMHVYIYTHTYIFSSVCVGDRALWMDPNGYMGDPFQSCVLLNLWHEYVLKEFFRTYIELVRTYVIQTWLIF